jgi:hypothetical protein
MPFSIQHTDLEVQRAQVVPSQVVPTGLEAPPVHPVSILPSVRSPVYRPIFQNSRAVVLILIIAVSAVRETLGGGEIAIFRFFRW